MTARPSIRIAPLHVADFVHPAESALAGRTGIVMAFAVVHPDGVLLFDTGIGFADPGIEAAYRPTIRGVPELLRASDVDPDDVTVLACSHLHFDHVGQNAAFPGRPIHVQAAELAAADGPDYTIPGWVHFPDARYVTHDGETEVFEGVRLVPTPGHTPGHQSLLVEAAEGRTVIAGQAVYTRAEWDGSDDPAVSGHASGWDQGLYRASVRRLRALAPDVLLFGHDR